MAGNLLRWSICDASHSCCARVCGVGYDGLVIGATMAAFRIKTELLGGMHNMGRPRKFYGSAKAKWVQQVTRLRTGGWGQVIWLDPTRRGQLSIVEML
eukprot:scaffold94997_cov64-Cyclotella_meneghiniana.AAC.3